MVRVSLVLPLCRCYLFATQAAAAAGPPRRKLLFSELERKRGGEEAGSERETKTNVPIRLSPQLPRKNSLLLSCVCVRVVLAWVCAPHCQGQKTEV